MHLLGTWGRTDWLAGWPEPEAFGDLRVHSCPSVALYRQNRRLLAIEGVVFGDSGQYTDPANAPHEAYGVFAYVRADRDEGLVQIGGDYLGFAPLFYYIDGETLAFASCLSVLKHFVPNPSCDFEAWDDILRLNDILGDKTVIRGVRRLQSGECIEIRNGKIAVKRVWEPRVVVPMRPDEYVERNNELLLDAMRATREDDRSKIVLLSGGDDSRRLAAAASAESLSFSCATQSAIHSGGVDSDVVIAQQVAKLLEVPHITTELPTTARALKDAVLREYWMGFETRLHDWVFPLVRKLPPGSLVYDGIVGDVTVNAHYFRKFEKSRQWFDDADRMSDILCRGAAIQLRSDLVTSTLQERIRTALAAMPKSPHRLTLFFLLNHTRRTIATWMELFRLHGHQVCAPYAYPAFFEQSLAMEVQDYLGCFYQRVCTERLDPRMAAIPSTREARSKVLAVDLAGAKRDRLQMIARRAPIRTEVADLFPQLRSRLRFRNLLGGKTLLSLIPNTGLWWLGPAIRFSRFLDWLDDRSPPSPELAPEEPAFVQQQYAAMGLDQRHY